MEKMSKESQMSIKEMLDEYVVRKISFEEDRKNIIDEIQVINKEIQDKVISESRIIRGIEEDNNSKTEDILNDVVEQLKDMNNDIESIKKIQFKLSKFSLALIILSSLSFIGAIVAIILLIK